MVIPYDKEHAGRGVTIKGVRLGVGDKLTAEQHAELVSVSKNDPQEWKRVMAFKILNSAQSED